MSVASCTAFLQHSQDDPDFAALLRAVTDTRELIALGLRSGYSFDLDELATASSMRAVAQAPPTDPLCRPDADGTGDTTFHHYEFDLHEIPAMQPLAAELAQLTIKPTSVDLEAFHAASRPDDLQWTSMSPAAPGFSERYDEIMGRHWDGSSGEHHERRDFHLVNLDQHVDHPLYESYFEAKLRTVRHLEHVFGCNIRFSGSMWYPPFSYRLWHTNETQPGWRMYLVDFDEMVAPTDARSFFRYMNPRTKDLVTLRDRPKMLRIFKVDQRPDQLLWHCIVNGADRNRWSFGFVVPDDWLERLSPLLGDTATPAT
jgi:hypothetical protein